MKNLLKKYKEMTYEERTVFITSVTTALNSVVAVAKIVFGLFTDFILCITGIFSALLLLAKLQCILAAKTEKVSFETRKLWTSIFLLAAGAVYIFYSARTLILDVEAEKYSGVVSIVVAAFGFGEMGLAVVGLIQTRKKGFLYQNIRIINFASALTAIMTAQVALLSAYSTGAGEFNAYTGMAVGVITLILAEYVYFAPQIETMDREYNEFCLRDGTKNSLVDMQSEKVEVTLYESKIYGNYSYCAEVKGDRLEGKIVKGEGFFPKTPLVWKILLIILSEILIFVWFFGYLGYFFRTANMPKQLELKMQENGFEKIFQGKEKSVDI